MNKKLNKELKEIAKSLNELKAKKTKWSKRPLTNGGLLKIDGIAVGIIIALCAIPLLIYKVKDLVRNNKRKEEPETVIAD